MSFDKHVIELELLERRIIKDRLSEQFRVRIEGMSRKEAKRKKEEIKEDLKGIEKIDEFNGVGR